MRGTTAGRTPALRGTKAAVRRKYVPTAERRRQILDVAAQLFAARGYAGTTTKRIAARAGTSETVLFRHFPTKEKLYAALLEQRIPDAAVTSWLRDLRAIADRRDDEALFTAVATGILASYRDDSVTQRLMLFAALESHEVARLFQLKYTAPLASFLREYVVRRQSEGAFRPTKPEVVVHALLGVPAHFGQWSSLGVNPLGLAATDVANHARTLLVGIRLTR
jgi:TetR/AcrR family transcriptional regulator